MLIKFGIPILAAAALGFGAATTMMLTPQEQITPAPHPPAVTSLGANTVAGLGEMQPAGESIAIGTALSGVVRDVYVTTGTTVSKGDPLFAIDDRDLRAELAIRERTLAVEKARLTRLKAGTRPEDLPPARARVDAAQVAVDRAKDAWSRGENLGVSGAMSQEELKMRRFALRQAQAELTHAQSELSRLEAGTWSPDIAIAEREVELARASVDRVRTELERLVVRAPVDGTVLRVDVRSGEFAQAGTSLTPLVVLGASGPLQVRVQVDEEDASRVQPVAAAEGFVRGRERTRVDLAFVGIEPRVVPKTSLTGSTTERVDTRVLFVVYEVVGTPERVYAGQKLDVFIKAGSQAATVSW